MTLSKSKLLSDHHILEPFDCGVASLNEWLRRRARANQAGGASRTFVVAEGEIMVGYFSLASGSINLLDAPGGFRRNMPDPIPVAVLGRLAVSRTHQGRGLGGALLRDAFKRVLAAAENIGVRGIVVHAISDAARDFYLSLGFQSSLTQPMTLLIPLTKLRASL